MNIYSALYYIYIYVTLQSYELQEEHPNIHTMLLYAYYGYSSLDVCGFFMYGMHKYANMHNYV